MVYIMIRSFDVRFLITQRNVFTMWKRAIFSNAIICIVQYLYPDFATVVCYDQQQKRMSLHNHII